MSCSSDGSPGTTGQPVGGSGAAGTGGSNATGGSGGSSGGNSTGGSVGETGGAAETGGSAGSVETDAGTDAAPDEGDGGIVIPSDGGSGGVKIFDGTTLDGWTQVPADSWEVKDGAMASKGTARGYIYTAKDYENYRVIFTLRQVSGNHQPCILIFGTRPPPSMDALGAIQIQPPNGYGWDYRPGHNDAGKGLFTQTNPKLDIHQWSRCEVLVKGSVGEARMACCQMTTDTPCKGIPTVTFKDPTAAKKGPFALQMHNGGIHDEYKDLTIEENPTVDDFITTK
jgi:hypothetical protein